MILPSAAFIINGAHSILVLAADEQYRMNGA
jgi:hypothetical protein